MKPFRLYRFVDGKEQLVAEGTIHTVLDVLNALKEHEQKEQRQADEGSQKAILDKLSGRAGKSKR